MIKGGIKTGGRRKGTPNKTTALYSSMINFIFSGHIERLNKELGELKGEKYINAIIQLGKLLNVNSQRDYTYINELIINELKNQLKQIKNENTKAS